MPVQIFIGALLGSNTYIEVHLNPIDASAGDLRGRDGHASTNLLSNIIISYINSSTNASLIRHSAKSAILIFS